MLADWGLAPSRGQGPQGMPQAQELGLSVQSFARSMVGLGGTSLHREGPPVPGWTQSCSWLWAAPLWELGEYGWVWGLTGGWGGASGPLTGPSQAGLHVCREHC